MLIETFMRKQLGLKAHTVTRVEETEQYMIVHIDRLGGRLLRCGVCRQRCRKVHSVRKAAGVARSVDAKVADDTALPPTTRGMSPVRCAGGGFPWAEPWARTTPRCRTRWRYGTRIRVGR